jgi:phosphoribosylanthranilate isomerase
MKLKVCGMKYVENIEQVAALQPDYMGFIFYEKSKRNFEGVIPKLSKSIKKTGVFVNEHLEIVSSFVQKHQLEAIQLHGDESVNYIIALKALFRERASGVITGLKNAAHANKDIEIIKVFGVKDHFDFDILKPYEEVVDFFLFDTKGKERGGNGVKFDWTLLKSYPYSKPFFLSGGIGLEDVDEVSSFLQGQESPTCFAIDVNSKFEIEPGIKNIEKLKALKKKI